MGNPYVGNAATFLIQTLFGLYILLVMLRLLLQLTRADFYNPISQFIVKATQPPLKPLRQFIPGFAGVDTASIVLILALQFIELWLVYAVLGYAASFAGLSVLALAEVLSLVLNVFIFSILIMVIISWVNPGLHNPITSLLFSLTEPVLRPARRMIPPIGGLDLSPIVAIIALQLVSMLLVAPVRDLGKSLF